MPKVASQLKIIFHLMIAAVCVVAVASLNYALIINHFRGEFSQNMASIEISYIQMAKFWVEGGGLWQPLWYLGYPWHVFYTPLLPALEVLLNKFAGMSLAHAYRVVTGAGYVLVPVTTFLFVWQITKSKTGALVAGLFYTVVPSLIAILFSEVAADSVSGILEPRRFAILVRWGEGPHTLALVFLPLFGLFLSRYFDGLKPVGSGKRRFADLVLASFFLGMGAVTNAIVLWASILLYVSYALGYLTQFGHQIVNVFKSGLLLSAMTLGIFSFWYNLPFLKTFFREGGGALANWQAIFPWGFVIFLLVCTAIFWVVRRFLTRFRGLPFAVFWFLMLTGIVYVYYASGPAQLEYAPQALRLNTEADLTLSVLVGVVVSNLYLFLTSVKGKLRIPSVATAVAVVALPLAFLAYEARTLLSILPRQAGPLADSLIIGDIKNTSEYKVAQKVSELVRDTNQRVLVPGNYAFWLNYFVPVPQLRGALYQSATHYWPEHIYYQVTNGNDAEISLAWLKIANIGKLVYSPETYRDFKVPKEKFSGILTTELVDGADTYFSVPLKNDALAKVVDASAYKKIIKPTNAIDEEPIFAYLAWMEQKSEKKLVVNRVGRDKIKIAGVVGVEEAILVQETYDSGWKVDKSGWKIRRDPLDFMVLEPKKSGSFELDLVYGKPIAVYLGYLISLITVVLVIGKFFGISLTGLRKR